MFDQFEVGEHFKHFSIIHTETCFVYSVKMIYKSERKEGFFPLTEWFFEEPNTSCISITLQNVQIEIVHSKYN